MHAELDRNEILKAIGRELYVQEKRIELRVFKRQREERLWRLTVERTEDFSQLDENLEGADAWWPEPEKGIADVLAVIPEEEQIILRYASTTPPDTNQKIFIYPPSFLESLRNAWNDLDWYNQICRKYELLLSHSFQSNISPFFKDAFTFRLKWLRDAQRGSFRLLDYSCGFLWGPPGTGKTTTLGVLLSEYLLKFPDNKILLLSTTNVAVDEALTSIDKALEKAQRHIPDALSLRNKIKRIGAHFRPEYYAGRNHLLPASDERILEELIKHESLKPNPEDAQKYAAWKEKKEFFQKQMKRKAREVIKNSSLCALTSTRALFQLDILREFYPFDLIVFDESSQMSKAHALAIAPLGKSAIFAGDPKQLSPIVKATQPDVLKWLGESIFLYMRDDLNNTVMLTEQSRMVVPICKIVSNVFYNRKLVVAMDKISDPAWRKERQISALPNIKPVTLTPVDAEGTWSQKYGGFIRFDSAKKAVEAVALMIGKGVEPSKIAILTPFRAQRRLIRVMLRNHNVTRVLASTVHRVQGSERHVIIFDPVCGSSDFLSDDNGMRLINVAISRAMALLIILLSEGDKTNEVFNQISKMITHSEISESPIPLSEVVLTNGFPENFIGKFVEFPIGICKIIGLEREGNDPKVKVLDIESGRERKFSIRILKEKVV
ncbi:MAG: AAA family ATPase [Nitrospirae bacterium]|nr:AAA family ATPase [Nitrospirota bacterium]